MMRQVLGIVLCIPIAVTPLYALTDIWVSGTGSDTFGDGSSTNPYRTISNANELVAPGDTIKVRTGTYDKAAGETFPITIVDQVDIIGQESAVVDYPRIGGDVNASDSSVAALFIVDATSADRSSISLQSLYFNPEAYSGRDAPSTLSVKNGNGYDVTASFVHDCIVKRLAMNDGANADRAAIVFDAGHGILSFEVKNSTINASRLGGIDVGVGASADSDAEIAEIPIKVQNVTIECREDELAEFGIRYRGTGERFAQFKTRTIDCTIDSTNVSSSSYGADTGIIFAAEPTGHGNIQFRVNDCETSGNLVTGCRDEGILLRTNAGTNLGHITLNVFFLNQIVDNGGAGVRVDWGTAGSVRYIKPVHNLIAHNQYGFHLENFVDGGNTGGSLSWSSNDTVAENGNEGCYSAGSADDHLPVIVNCIVWDNNAGGAQHNFPSGWVPSSNVSYSDFQNLSGGTGNIDDDPLFVDAAAGDFHIEDTSPCIDVATSSLPNTLPTRDIDGEGRVQDGDDNGSVHVDMGVDELPDPTP